MPNSPANQYAYEKPSAPVNVSTAPIERFALVCVPSVLLLRDIAPSLTLLFAVIAAGIVGAATFGKSLAYRGSMLWLMFIAVGAFSFAMTLIYRPVPMQSLAALALMYALIAGMSIALARRRKEYIIAIAADMTLVAAVTSMALWAMGVQPAVVWAEGVGNSSMMQMLGFNILRQVFPLMGGSTAQAAIFGLAALVCLYRKGWAYKAVFGLMVLGLFLADGRAALLALVLALIPCGRKWLVLLIPLGIPALLALFAFLPSSFLGRFARSGQATEITSGNNRVEIWEAGYRYLIENPYTLSFGNGFYGQSVFMGGFQRTFQNFTADSHSMHNMGLQLWIDQGIAGVLVVTAMAYAVLSRLSGIGAAMMAYILIVGLFDTFGTIYWDVGFFVFALLAWSVLKRKSGEI